MILLASFVMRQNPFTHLFFDCVVAKQTWCLISEVVGVDLGDSFESIGTCWLSNKRHLVTNIVSSATLWSIWKLRNDLCFQNGAWKNIEFLLLKILWAAAELANSVPREREGAPLKLRGGGQEEGDKATQVAWMTEPGD